MRELVLAGGVRFPGAVDRSEERPVRFLLIAAGMVNVALGVIDPIRLGELFAPPTAASR